MIVHRADQIEISNQGKMSFGHDIDLPEGIGVRCLKPLSMGGQSKRARHLVVLRRPGRSQLHRQPHDLGHRRWGHGRPSR